MAQDRPGLLAPGGPCLTAPLAKCGYGDGEDQATTERAEDVFLSRVVMAQVLLPEAPKVACKPRSSAALGSAFRRNLCESVPRYCKRAPAHQYRHSGTCGLPAAPTALSGQYDASAFPSHTALLTSSASLAILLDQQQGHAVRGTMRPIISKILLHHVMRASPMRVHPAAAGAAGLMGSAPAI